MWYRIAMLSLAMLATVSRGGDIPSEVGWPLQKAYIPVGFDDNDKVQITVTGEFPNTCFHVGPYSSKVDENAKIIYLEQKAYSYLAMCLDILIPFSQTIDVGLVPAGNYAVIDSSTGTQVGRTSISRAVNAGPDDFLYAVVNDASVHATGTKGKNELTLSMQFTDRCTKLGKVDVHYYNDVIVVQPIAARIADANHERCAPANTRFQFTQPLQDGVSGSFLLHVRSMNGQAINKVVELQ